VLILVPDLAYNETARASSPDGAIDAVVVTENGGATVSLVTSVLLLRSGEEFQEPTFISRLFGDAWRNDHQISVFTAVSVDENEVSVGWRSADRLSIRSPSGSYHEYYGEDHFAGKDIHVALEQYDRSVDDTGICRETIPLPEPRFFIPEVYDADTGEKLVETTPFELKGEFKDMVVTPRLAQCDQPGIYWVPGDIYEASDELGKMLPADYYVRLLTLFGASGGESHGDFDIGETEVVLDTLLQDTWDINWSENGNETPFQSIVECMGTPEGDLSLFYTLLANLAAKKHGTKFLAHPDESEWRKEYEDRLKMCHVTLE